MIKKLIRRIFPIVDLTEVQREISNTQIQQRHLFHFYQNLKNAGLKLPEFQDTGFRVYSQCDEDGKVMYIFSLIGFTNKKCVDFAFSSPHGANTTNLILNWGFSGLLVDGNDLSKTRTFFNSHPDAVVYPPESVQAWITAENVNAICNANGITGEIDFFSLDMDGVDYYIWKELDAIKPRVIILEYQDILGPALSVAVPYSPDFDRHKIHPDFFGASLQAFVNLGKEKGYRLVGINSLGYNAFFIKNGVGDDLLPEISSESCFSHSKVKDGMKMRYPEIKNLPWVTV